MFTVRVLDERGIVRCTLSSCLPAHAFSFILRLRFVFLTVIEALVMPIRPVMVGEATGREQGWR